MVVVTREEYEAAGREGEKIPVAVAARYNRADRKLEISFAHGVDIAVPIVLIQEFHLMAKWPTPFQLSRIEIWGAGSSLYFPHLDELVWATGLLKGVYGTKIWMEEMTRATSSARARARRKLIRAKGRQTGRSRVKAAAPLLVQLERTA
jgi:hypothetical protein